MNNFKPKKDSKDQSNLQQDISNSSVLRLRQQRSKYYLASRKHIIIGITIIGLLLLIFTINSAIKSPTYNKKQDVSVINSEHNIDISDKSTLLSNQPSLFQNQIKIQNDKQPKNSLPKIKQEKVKHIEIDNNISDALRQEQTLTNQSNDLLSATITNYTLQLSGASRSDLLELLAKNNRLTNYKIYKTIRNGKSWYILTYGNYLSMEEAKNAISILPNSLQEQKPWVRKFQQN